MASIFTAEELAAPKPIILIHCENEQLLKTLLTYYRSEFKIIIVTQKNIVQDHQSLYVISYAKAHLLAGIKETIDYALIITDSPQEYTLIHALDSKFRKDNTHVVLTLPIYNPAIWLSHIHQTLSLKHLSLVFFGNLFGPEVTFENEVTKLVQTVLRERRITLNGNDLSPIYPISEVDFVTGINHVLFGATGKSRLFYLFYKHPQTIVSAIHLLKRTEPDLSVEYSEDRSDPVVKHLPFPVIEKEIKERASHMPVYIDRNLLGFEQSVSLMMNNKSEIKPLQTQAPKKKKRRSLKIGRGFSFFALVLLLGVIFYISGTVLAAVGSLYLAKQSVKEFSKGNLSKAEKNLEMSRTAGHLVRPQLTLAAPLLKGPLYTPAHNYLLFVDSIDQIHSMDIFDSATSTKIASNPSLIPNLEYWYWHAQQANLDYPQLKLGSILTPSNSNILRLAHEIPALLGFNEEQTYLLLLQNENELRPNGGFIGSVGIMTVKKGEITDLKLDDVYNVDGQLKGHIEPPYIVRRNLQPHLYLRDSNFHPDFEKSATSAAQLYNLATGKQIDGIIAVNTEFMKTLLNITGPVQVTQLNKEVSADDAAAILQDEIQKDFFPGSTKKKDVLNGLLNQIIIQFEDHPEYKIKLAKQLPYLLESKTLQLSSKDTSMQKLFKSLGYAGSLTDNRPVSEDGIRDIAGIYEANIGVNKVNNKIKRAVEYSINLDEKTSTKSTISLTLKNEHKEETYSSYIQVIMPKGSVIESISINGETQKTTDAITEPRVYEARGFKAPTELEVEQKIEENSLVAGFVVNIFSGEEQKIAVTYKNGAVGALPNLIDYSLLYFKQSGTKPYPLTVSINHPQTYSPQKTEDASFTPKSVEFEQKVDRDKIFEVELVRN